jgi:hypothetical protein
MMTLAAGRQAVKYSRTDISGLCWEYQPLDNTMFEAILWFSDDTTVETSDAANQSQIVSKSSVQLIGKPATLLWSSINQTSSTVHVSGE